MRLVFGAPYILDFLNHAHALFTCPAWAARVAREKACDNARAVAVIWDMHAFLSVISIGAVMLSLYFAIWLYGTK